MHEILNSCITYLYYVSEIRISSPARRLGNSLVVIIPAPEARRAGVREGTFLRGTLQPEGDELFGLLKDLPYEPFRRVHEDRRDRI